MNNIYILFFVISIVLISFVFGNQVSAITHYNYENEVLYSEKLLDDCHEYVLSLDASISDVDCVSFANMPDPTLYESAKEYVDLNYPELVENVEVTEEEDEEKEE